MLNDKYCQDQQDKYLDVSSRKNLEAIIRLEISELTTMNMRPSNSYSSLYSWDTELAQGSFCEWLRSRTRLRSLCHCCYLQRVHTFHMCTDVYRTSFHRKHWFRWERKRNLWTGPLIISDNLWLNFPQLCNGDATSTYLRVVWKRRWYV